MEAIDIPDCFLPWDIDEAIGERTYGDLTEYNFKRDEILFLLEELWQESTIT